jgi:hypothetical protein
MSERCESNGAERTRFELAANFWKLSKPISRTIQAAVSRNDPSDGPSDGVEGY